MSGGATHRLPGLVYLSDAEVLEGNDPARLFILEAHTNKDKLEHNISDSLLSLLLSKMICVHCYTLQPSCDAAM